MDKYKVLRECGAGVFGVTLLVEELSTAKRFAVKKVECIDERHSSLALEEARPLLKLQHPNICPYTELFMDWDNQTSSLFFCLVMDYCDGGNLADVVRRNRRQKKKTEEKMVQRFLGQMTDVLVYIHEKELPHRNLKPSNILVSSEEDVFIMLSDFLPEILLTDWMKVRIRADPEQKMFMAPESEQFTYGKDSDIWSLGCILLDLMTTSVKSEPDIANLLQRIKINSSGLDSDVETLQREVGYPEELCQLLLKMLKVPPTERPSAKDLVNEPYIKKCLALIGSPLSGMKKTLPPDVLDQVNDKSLKGILGFMRNYIDVEEAQLLALENLATYTGDKDGFQAEIIQCVSQVMTAHRESYDAQLGGSRILRRLLSQELERGDIEQYVSSASLVCTLVEAARTFSQDALLLLEVLNIMTMLSVSKAAAKMLGRVGFLSDLKIIVENSLENKELCHTCCTLLWSLAMTECVSGECLKRALPLIEALIQKHHSDAQLLESASPALWILCLKGHVPEERIEPVTVLLLDSLQKHTEHPVIAKNVCLALTGLVINSEFAAYRVLVPVSGRSGLSLLKDVYRLYSDDPEMVENICQLLNEMANYESTHSEMNSQHVDDLMREIRDKYESVEEIVTLVESALHSLKK